MTEIRWHGRGGQGAFTASKILGAAASLFEDKYALSLPSFGPERRGAPVQAFTKIDNKPIINRSEVALCDYIIFLDDTLFDISNLSDLKPGGKIIINSANGGKYQDDTRIISINADSIAMEILHMPITNTAMLGALIGDSGILELQSILSAAAHYLPKKILDKNIAVMEKAYHMAREGKE